MITSALSTSLPTPFSTSITKLAEINLHFVRECVAIGDVYVLHVLKTSQFVDIFMKGRPTSMFS
jgi:hypothetical protein